jgi:hypothetical protein
MTANEVHHFKKEIKCDPIELSIFGNRFMSIAGNNNEINNINLLLI